LAGNEAIMAGNRSSNARRASARNPAEVRTRQAGHAHESAAIDTTDEASGLPAQRRAIEEAMARQNVRNARSPGAVGPIGRMVLLIALATLGGLIAVWVLLAL
jgi:hypothetical protein